MNMNNKPELIMMIGLPASGKSTMSEKYRKNGYAIHSSDAIRREIYGELRQDNPQKVFAILHNRVKNDLKNGVSCVFDATNINRNKRMAFLEEIKNIDCVKTAFLILTSVQECLYRNENRVDSVPEEVYDRMLRGFQIPYWYEGWDRIHIEVSKKDAPEIPELVLKDREALMSISQDNPHHSASIGMHMQLAEEYARKKSWGREIEIAAGVHDCGKLYTKSFINANGELTDVAHYYGHENVGAYMYLRHMLLEYQRLYAGKTMDDPDSMFKEVCYVAQLINWHMRPYLAWDKSDKARDKDRKLIGEQMYQDILKLHKADLAAH